MDFSHSKNVGESVSNDDVECVLISLDCYPKISH